MGFKNWLGRVFDNMEERSADYGDTNTYEDSFKFPTDCCFCMHSEEIEGDNWKVHCKPYNMTVLNTENHFGNCDMFCMK